MNQNNLAHALASALANPYSQYSSHYAQAVAKASNPHTTSEGYTLSSTYSPQNGRQTTFPTQPIAQRPVAVQHRQSQSSTWYQPGNHKCSYSSCTFTGSQKSVEIHMMDRHLIYPPSWDKQKKKPDWDADPSLKGKPVPIQGTNIILNTPEALEAWIAERKRRWPTSQRVADKKRKLEDAIQRGQIIPQDSPFGRKKPRRDETNTFKTDSHWRSREVDNGWRGRGRGKGRGGGMMATICNVITPQMDTPAVPGLTAAHDGPQLNTGDISEGDDTPDVFSSKAPIPVAQPPEESPLTRKANKQQSDARVQDSRVQHRVPKKPPHNPFASRPTLLRNLLLPEIRVTISNLSQAIRFLVDNDFLVGVELTPGEAEKANMIQVLEPAQPEPCDGS